MKVKVSSSTITTLNNLKGSWFIRNGQLQVIRDFQYITEKPEPPITRREKRKFDDTPLLYITDIRIEGYHRDLKFIGVFEDTYCIDMIEKHESTYWTFDLVQCRKNWTDIIEQKDAFLEYEARKEETELSEVIDLLLADKPINAIKKYKEITGASLVDSRDYVKNVMQPKYCEV